MIGARVIAQRAAGAVGSSPPGDIARDNNGRKSLLPQAIASPRTRILPEKIGFGQKEGKFWNGDENLMDMGMVMMIAMGGCDGWCCLLGPGAGVRVPIETAGRGGLATCFGAVTFCDRGPSNESRE